MAVTWFLFAILIGAVACQEADTSGCSLVDTWVAEESNEALRLQLYSDGDLFAYRALEWDVNSYGCYNQNQLTGTWVYDNTTSLLEVTYDDCTNTGCNDGCICPCGTEGWSGYVTWSGCKDFTVTETDGSVTPFRRAMAWEFVVLIVIALFLVAVFLCCCCGICIFALGACCFIGVCYLRVFINRKDYEEVEFAGTDQTSGKASIAVFEDL